MINQISDGTGDFPGGDVTPPTDLGEALRSSVTGLRSFSPKLDA